LTEGRAFGRHASESLLSSYAARPGRQALYDNRRTVRYWRARLSLIERSSGILRGTKHLSKRGRPLLRQAAYMFAVRNITTGGLFRAEYDALMARNGGQAMKALGAVMRSALRLMYSVARDRRTFTIEPPVRWQRVRTEARA
jgi:hypothetical protein